VLFLRQSTAVTLKIGPFLDDTDGKTPETGLTMIAADVRVSSNGAGFHAKSSAAAPVHDEGGFYSCVLDITDTGNLGRLQLFVEESGALPVWHEFTILTASEYEERFDTNAKKHTWHVAKSGNNSNKGHSLGDAKLTIQGVLDDAALNDGDKIIIHPGTYAEAVDLDTEGKSLILEGKHKDKCIIQPASGSAMKAETGCEFYNLSMISSVDADAIGLSAASKDGIRVGNCYIESKAASGAADGIVLGGWNCIIRNSHIKATYDAVNTGTSGSTFFDNCTLETDGSITAFAARAIVCSMMGKLLFENCVLKVIRTASSAERAACIESSGQVIMRSCTLWAETKTDATGDAYGAYAITGAGYDGKISLQNCVIKTISNGGNDYDLVTAGSGEIIVNSSHFDPSKVSGSVHQMNQGWAAAVNAEADTALNTAIPGSPTADSINERVKAIDILAEATGDGDLAAIKTETDKIVVSTAGAASLWAHGSLADTLANKDANRTFNSATDSNEALRDRLDAVKDYVDELETRLTAARAGYLDELAAANIPADVDTLKGYCDKIDDATDGLTAIKAEVEGLAGAVMRGTDSAATEAKQDVIDANVDAILLDTGTDGVKLTDDAITSGKYDESTAHPITTAMQKAGSTLVAGTVVTDVGNSPTQFKTDLTEATNDHYNGRIVIFTSGDLQNQATDITDYDGTDKIITVTAMTETPAEGNTFVIV